jgi:hypothetical protein
VSFEKWRYPTKFVPEFPHDGIPSVEMGTLTFSTHGMPSSFRPHNGMPSYRQKLCGIPSGFLKGPPRRPTEYRQQKIN